MSTAMFCDGEILAAVMASLPDTGRGAKIIYHDGRVRHIEWSGAIKDVMPDGTVVTIKGPS